MSRQGRGKCDSLLPRLLILGVITLVTSVMSPEPAWSQSASRPSTATTTSAPESSGAAVLPTDSAAKPGSDQPTTSPAPATAGGDAGASSSDDLGMRYTRNLRAIEERVNTLKEKVFRSKARLLLLRETVLHGVVSGAKAVLYHVNKLGVSYVIESVTYFLDGSKIYSRADATGDLSKKEEIKIFEGNIPPGNHSVSVNLMLRGNGFGVFSYLSTYKIKVTHAYNFIAEEGKVSRLRIIAYEKNGLMRNFVERPNIRYDLVTDRNLPSGTESAEGQ